MSTVSTKSKPKLPLAVIPLALTYLAISLNMTIASVALPTISTQLAATSTQLTWIVNATPMASASLILFASNWAERFGRRRMLQTGLLIFIASASLTVFVTETWQLIALRGLTGVGSAVAMPAALALVFDTVPKQSRRTAIGIMMAAQAVGSLLGPIFGGTMLVTFGWTAAFAGVAPVIALAFLLDVWLIPKSPKIPRSEWTKVDNLGALTVAIASVGFLYALVMSGAQGQGQDAAIAGVIAVIAIAVLVWHERRTEVPIFEAEILKRPRFWVPTLAILLTQFALGGVMILTTQYIQLVLGLSALAAGLFLLPALLAWMVASSSAGLTSRRFGAVPVAAVTLALAAVGLLMLSQLGTSLNIPLIVAGLLLVGLMGAAPALMTHTAVDNYPPERRTIGSGINSITMRFGLSLGVATLSTVLTAKYAAQLLPALGGLAPDQANRADESIGGAVSVSKELSGDAGATLLESARNAYVSGFSLSLLIAAALLAATAIIVYLFLRKEPSLARGSAPAEIEETL